MKDDLNGEKWARTSPLPHLEGSRLEEPWPAWKVFGAIVLFFWAVMHAAWDLRVVVEWLSR